jgi:hypothetical protein
MTEQTTENAETAPPEQLSTEQPAETTDWKAKAREWERRAKENKSAADELAALKQSQMSEAERTAARLAELEQQAQAARSEALRYRVATRYGISDDDAELFLTAGDEETLERQARALSERNTPSAATATTAPAPRPDLTQGARDLPLNGDPLLDSLKKKIGIQ